MFTYLGHTIAGVGYRGKARDALFAALQAQVAAYTILPLTSFERAQIVNSLLIPRWVYKSLFMWDVCWGNRMETAFEEFVLQAPRVEKYLQYRLYTDVTEGGLGLHSASWAGLCALIQLVQRALRVPHRPMTRRTNSGHLPHMVEKYRKILLSFGMEMGRLPRAGQSIGRKAPKRAHDDLESLFDDEDSDDCRFESLVPHQYLQSLRPKSGTSPVQPNVEQSGHAWHQQGQPTGSTWYSDGSLLEGRAGTGVVNGPMRIQARVPGPQTIYRAEMYGIWIAACLAQPGDSIGLTTGLRLDASPRHPAHNRPTMICTTQRTSLSPPRHSKYVGHVGIGTLKRRIVCKIMRTGLATN